MDYYHYNIFFIIMLFFLIFFFCLIFFIVGHLIPIRLGLFVEFELIVAIK